VVSDPRHQQPGCFDLLYVISSRFGLCRFPRHVDLPQKRRQMRGKIGGIQASAVFLLRCFYGGRLFRKILPNTRGFAGRGGGG
jgi:hypothetical protein